MKAKFSKKQILFTVIALLLIIGISVPLAITASADNVNVYTKENPYLTMEHVYDKNISHGWLSDGEIKSQENGVYKIDSNAYAFWNEGDSLDFACVKAGFNEGNGGYINKSVMTLTLTIDSWNGTGNASIGIHVRNSLDAYDEGTFLCVRPGQIFLMYRDGYKSDVNRGPNKAITTDYPMELKMEIDFSKGKVSGYYKQSGTWVLLGNGKYKATPEVYVGIAAHGAQSTATYFDGQLSNFSYRLDAPEGYSVDNGTGGSEGTGATEPQINLPPDGPVVGDALLRETFTDGDIFPARKDATVANPLWTVNMGEAAVEIDEAQTNRWLSLTADNELMMTAGDMNWTDYSTSLKVRFDSKEVMKLEKNQISIMVRHRTVVVGGCYDYGITIINEIKNHEFIGQKIRLDYRSSEKNFAPRYTTLKEVYLSQGEMVELDKWHDVKIVTLDDTIQVYFDGQEVLTWGPEDRVDMDSISANEKTYPNLYGCVGIYSSEANAMIDDITVRKIEDPLGGSYDNMVGGIGGSFDEPIPDYIQDGYGRE